MIAISFSLALFQALFPLLGWLAGRTIAEYIKVVDHWIAFVLLLAIGSKMIYESFQPQNEERSDKLSLLTVIGQSIATSIDAFAVGISFAFLRLNIIAPVLIIGGITHLFAFVGLILGTYFGNKLGKRVEILGGVVLIAMGLKILLEHLIYHL
jgi:putative Mn2+ efflux pump MntP